MPVDPITDSTATWVLIAPEPPLDGNVFDVQSGATGVKQYPKMLVELVIDKRFTKTKRHIRKQFLDPITRGQP